MATIYLGRGRHRAAQDVLPGRRVVALATRYWLVNGGRSFALLWQGRVKRLRVAGGPGVPTQEGASTARVAASNTSRSCHNLGPGHAGSLR